MAFDDETTDVLIGGYLSKDAANDDYEAVLDSGGYLHGAVVVSKDLEGNLSVEQTDHMVREGAAGLGAVGFAVGLFAPPLLAATAVGCGDRCRRRQTVAPPDRQQTRGAGRGDHSARRRRSHRRLPTLGDQQGRTGRNPRHQESRRRGGRTPRRGPQRRTRRRSTEDGEGRHLTAAAKPGSGRAMSRSVRHVESARVTDDLGHKPICRPLAVDDSESDVQEAPRIVGRRGCHAATYA